MKTLIYDLIFLDFNSSSNINILIDENIHPNKNDEKN